MACIAISAMGQELVKKPATSELSVKQLLVLMKHYSESDVAEAGSGMKFLYMTEDSDEDMSYYTYAYGHDYEKGEKTDDGYRLKPTSTRGFYFKMQLDTSQQGWLWFVSDARAKVFMKAAARTEPFEYEGKTYYVNMKGNDGKLYIQSPWVENELQTDYVIYPPEQQESGLYAVQIEIYM